MSNVPTQPGSQDVVALALARLPQQWQSAPLVQGLLTALVSPMQDIENALQQLLTLYNISESYGIQLDMIGDVVVQPRGGLTDAVYQLYLYAKIAANISAGTTEQLINLTKLVLNDDTFTIAVITEGVAACSVNVYGPDVPATATITVLFMFLQQAVKAGVHLYLTYENAPDSQTFYTARASFPTGALTAGQSTITVGSTAGFPVVGQLQINYGLTDAEVVTYVGIDPTHFFLGTGQLANNHPAGASCKLVGSTGLGLGTTTDGTIGGTLASALG